MGRQKRSSKNTQRFPYHMEGERVRQPGWGGVNLHSDVEYVPPHEASETLNWSNRATFAKISAGGLYTRPGYADQPHYGLNASKKDATVSTTPIRLLNKFYPTISLDDTVDGGTFTQNGVVCRIIGGDGSGKFQVYNSGTGVWDNPAAGATALNGLWYPQNIVFGDNDTQQLLFTDPSNGLQSFDGTTYSTITIPKNTDGTAITGAFWLDQIDGRAIVSGNASDSDEYNIVYYSAPGNASTLGFTSAAGGGSFPVYEADSKSGDSAPRFVTGTAVFRGKLLVFTADMRYVVTGIGANLRVEMYPGEGSFNGNCISVTNDGVYWFGIDGFFKWNGGDAQNIGMKVWPDHKGWGYTTKHKWTSFVYKRQVWFNLTTSNGAYRNYVYSVDESNHSGSHIWHIYDMPIGPAFHSSETILDGDLLIFAGLAAHTMTVTAGVAHSTSVNDDKNIRDGGVAGYVDENAVDGSLWGSVTTAQPGTVLIDNTASFTTYGITVGDVVVNDTDGSTAAVVSIDSGAQLTTSALAGGGDNLWGLGDTYRIGRNVYKTYVFGHDLPSGQNTYADDVYTNSASGRVGTSIDSTWVTGKQRFGSINFKTFERNQLHIGIVNSIGLTHRDTGATGFTTIKLQFALNDGSFNNLNVSATAATPYQVLGFSNNGANNINGTFVQQKFVMSATKQVQIKELWIEVNDKGRMENLG